MNLLKRNIVEMENGIKLLDGQLAIKFEDVQNSYFLAGSMTSDAKEMMISMQDELNANVTSDEDEELAMLTSELNLLKNDIAELLQIRTDLEQEMQLSVSKQQDLISRIELLELE